MSGDAEQEYFSDGITEDIITDLSKISGLFVPSRNSSFTYKGTPVKVETVARELGVRHVLEGSVRKSGDPRPDHRPAHRQHHRRTHVGRAIRP